MKQLMCKLILFFLFSFILSKCGDANVKEGCYASNGCHDAFANCYVTFALIVPNINELNSLCIYRAYSCRKFCEKCEKYTGSPGHAPCFTNQYKPFFGFSDGKEK
jgi:hypothetical protein